MWSKEFSIADSHTKSRLSFTLPDAGHRTPKRSLFRDPAAVPMLEHIAEALRLHGYKVTKPRPGKACHGGCRVIFSDVQITVILHVRRREGKVEFEIITWPSQTLLQRFSGRKAKLPDCEEWGELCSAMNDVLARDSRVQSLRWRTFMDADESD